MEILEKIFGGKERVKIMRLFLFNPDRLFSADEVSKRSDAGRDAVRRQISIFEKVGLVKRKTGAGGGKGKGRKVLTGWLLDQSFPYLKPVQNLLIQQVLVSDGQIVDRISSAGKLKLVVIAGVFLQDADSRIDLLVVGDNLRKGSIDKAIKALEAEIGKELRYSVFETADFNYRLGMYDKLIRDVFDYSHRKILDRLGLALN
jgi:hypothetical protein